MITAAFLSKLSRIPGDQKSPPAQVEHILNPCSPFHSIQSSPTHTPKQNVESDSMPSTHPHITLAPYKDTRPLFQGRGYYDSFSSGIRLSFPIEIRGIFPRLLPTRLPAILTHSLSLLFIAQVLAAIHRYPREGEETRSTWHAKG